MVMTNGITDDKTFGSKITKNDYPIFIYIFIGVLIITTTYLIFFLEI